MWLDSYEHAHLSLPHPSTHTTRVCLFVLILLPTHTFTCSVQRVWHTKGRYSSSPYPSSTQGAVAASSRAASEDIGIQYTGSWEGGRSFSLQPNGTNSLHRPVSSSLSRVTPPSAFQISGTRFLLEGSLLQEVSGSGGDGANLLLADQVVVVEGWTHAVVDICMLCLHQDRAVTQ